MVFMVCMRSHAHNSASAKSTRTRRRPRTHRSFTTDRCIAFSWVSTTSLGWTAHAAVMQLIGPFLV